MHKTSRLLALLCFSLAAIPAPLRAQSMEAKTILEAAATAMGGLPALRSIKNEIVESEGKQFDSSSTPQPLGPTRQISTFRYTLSRDLTQPRLRLEWNSRNQARSQEIRFVEVIDGTAGLLQEAGGKQTRLHPGRLATRMREEKRTPAKLLLVAMAEKSLKRLADTDGDGKTYHVVSFVDGGNEFRAYFDSTTKLPAQVEILEDDPLEGDSRYTLRYSDWRKVDNLQLPFALRL